MNTTCTCKPTASLAEQAATDQAAAREREFDRKARPWLWAFVVVMAVVGAYAVAAGYGLVPATPWSSVGQVSQVEQHDEPAPINLDDFDIPEGWAPAVPLETEPPAVTI